MFISWACPTSEKRTWYSSIGLMAHAAVIDVLLAEQSSCVRWWFQQKSAPKQSALILERETQTHESRSEVLNPADYRISQEMQQLLYQTKVHDADEQTSASTLMNKAQLSLTNRALLVCKVVEVWQDFLSEYVDKKFTYGLHTLQTVN